MADIQSPESIGTVALDPPAPIVAQLMKLLETGQLDQLARDSMTMLREHPRSYILWTLLGSANFGLAKKENAEKCALRALELQPEIGAAHYNLANALRVQNKLDEALTFYRKAVRLDPSLGMAHHHLGLLHYNRGDNEAALLAWEKAIQADRNFADAHYCRGVILTQKGNVPTAIEAFDEAIRLKPGYADAYHDKGVALQATQQFDQATALYRKAIKLNPNYAAAFNSLGNSYLAKGDLPKALEAFERALTLAPALTNALSLKLSIQAHLCDLTATKEIIVPDDFAAFEALPLEDDPRRQQVRSSRTWASLANGADPLPLPSSPQHRPDKIRVGYFSADFCDHATMHLVSGLFREHDRSKFEIFVYSYGRERTGHLIDKLRRDQIHYHDVHTLSDKDLVTFARSHALDIAIDLKGYTQFTRSRLFGYRLAPIQINYLAYPGTLGSTAFDYIIADRKTIPTTQRSFYTENVIYLPHSYQPNDTERSAALTTTTRSDFGLPDEKIVFCCFNGPYKIGAREFDIWMRILKRIEGSVLWLLRSNPWMEENLRREATIRGVSPDRIVLADKAVHALHLARHKHADLFLDTFNCNAHTTASDALGMGLPIVTKAGKQFAARVGASLLNAIGLPDLIAESEASYEAKIIDLATNPEKLKEVRERLARNRLTQPLFDTKRYTRNFEAGLERAFDRYLAGEKPSDISIFDKG